MWPKASHAAVFTGALLFASLATPVYKHYRRQNSIRDDVLPKARGGALTGTIHSIIDIFEGIVQKDKASLEGMIRYLKLSPDEAASSSAEISSSTAEILHSLFTSLIIIDEKAQCESCPTLNDLISSATFHLDVLAMGIVSECPAGLLSKLVALIEWGLARLLAMQLLFIVSEAVEISDHNTHDIKNEALDLLMEFLNSITPGCSSGHLRSVLTKSMSSFCKHSARSPVYRMCRNAIISDSGKGTAVAFSTFSVLSEPLFIRSRNVFPSKKFDEEEGDGIELVSPSELFNDAALRRELQSRIIFHNEADRHAPNMFKVFTSQAMGFMQRNHRAQARREVFGRIWGNYTGVILDLHSNTISKETKRRLVRPPKRTLRVRCLAGLVVFVIASDTLVSAILTAEFVGSALAFGGGWLFGSRLASPPSESGRGFVGTITGWFGSKAQSAVLSLLTTTLTLSFVKVLLSYTNQLLTSRIKAEIGSELRFQRKNGLSRLGSDFVKCLEAFGLPWFCLEASPSKNKPNSEPRLISQIETQCEASRDELNFNDKTSRGCELGLAIAIAMRTSVGMDSELSLLNWRALRTTGKSPLLGGRHLGASTFALFSHMALKEKKVTKWLPRSSKQTSSLLHQINADTMMVTEHLSNLGVMIALGGMVCVSVGKAISFAKTIPLRGSVAPSSSFTATVAFSYCAAATLVAGCRVLATGPMVLYTCKRVFGKINRLLVGSDVESPFARMLSHATGDVTPMPFPSLIADIPFVAAFVNSIKGQAAFVGGSDWSKLTLKGLADSLCRSLNSSNVFALTAYRSEETCHVEPVGSHLFSNANLGDETDDEELFGERPINGTRIFSAESGGGIGAFDPQFLNFADRSESKKTVVNTSLVHKLPARMVTIGSVVTDLTQSPSPALKNVRSPSVTGSFKGLSVLSYALMNDDCYVTHPFITLITAPHTTCPAVPSKDSLMLRAKWISEAVSEFVFRQQSPKLPPRSSYFLHECVLSAIALQRTLLASQREDGVERWKPHSEVNPNRPMKVREPSKFVSSLVNEFLDVEELKLLRPASSCIMRGRNFLSSFILEHHTLLCSRRHFLSARILGVESYLAMRGLLVKHFTEDFELNSNQRTTLLNSLPKLARRIFSVFISTTSLNQSKLEESLRLCFYAVVFAAAVGILRTCAYNSTQTLSAASPLRHLVATATFEAHIFCSAIHLPYLYFRLHRFGDRTRKLSIDIRNVVAVGQTSLETGVLSHQIYRNGPRDGESYSPCFARDFFGPPSRRKGENGTLLFDANGLITGGFVLSKGISFRDVSFTHSKCPLQKESDDVPTALNSFTAYFPANKMSGIIGPSGSGKTTIVNLLCRGNEVGSGTTLGVHLDDIPIERFNTQYLRSMIVNIDQSAGLIPEASFSEQISSFASISPHRNGKPKKKVTFRDVVLAAKMANCHELILSKPGGYDFIPSSSALSSGEVQRVILARSLLYLQTISSCCERSSKIIILDEASNRLDAVNEVEFTKALSHLRSSGAFTILNISHRMSTLSGSDHVVMVSNGECVGSGNPRVLLANESQNMFREYSSLQRFFGGQLVLSFRSKASKIVQAKQAVFLQQSSKELTRRVRTAMLAKKRRDSRNMSQPKATVSHNPKSRQTINTGRKPSKISGGEAE